MGMSTHKHAPWRKAILVPCWAVQLFVEVLMIIGIAVMLSRPEEYRPKLSPGGRIVLNIVSSVYIIVVASCLVLTIVEIILLARHKLRPRAFLIMNSVKTVIWTGMWLYDVIGTATQKYVAVNTTVLVILISAVLCVSFWVPFIYGIVIFRRHRNQSHSYRNLEDPANAKASLVKRYPTLVHDKRNKKGYISPVSAEMTGGLDSHGDLGHGGHYNHERDLSFEEYRKSMSIGTDQTPLVSVTAPQLHVEIHDKDVFEMETRPI